MGCKFLFFAGKGGVGKTTCAAARALAAARSGARVLVVSTDPAHSLGDAVGVRLSSRPSTIRAFRSGQGGRAALHAVELDAQQAFARWLAVHGRALGEALEHGTWLDRVDIDALLGLSIPGIDELLGLVEIVRLASRPGQDYDQVIVDTAPTGHTLRLLASPHAVAGAAAVLDALQAEHRLIRDRLARVGRPDAADRLIALVAEQARETGALITDARQSAVHWVMLPEELSLAESADALATLRRGRVPVAEIIVNRLIPDGPPCPICDRRRADQLRVAARVPRRLGSKLALRMVPDEAREPRGLAALERIGRHLTDVVQAVRPTSARTADVKVRTTSAFSAAHGNTTPPESIAALRGARLLLFGGKGGVGKTTAAAAAAVRMARAEPTVRILLLSTDPAHSLADVFDAAVGDSPGPLPGAPSNLHVREVDAPRLLAAHRRDIEAALDEIADRVGFTGGGGISELMDLAPPGIDELLGMVSVIESERSYRVIIVDTAPTGHALRLLQMPDAAHEWVEVLMRLLLKYRSVVRPGRLAQELVALSKSIRRLQEVLRDAARSRFVVVTRAAEVPRLETERLLGELRRMRIAAPAVIVNAMTLAARRCRRCLDIAAAERRQLTSLARVCRRRRPECAIILTPLAAPPPRGVAELDRWAREWSSRQV